MRNKIITFAVIFLTLGICTSNTALAQDANLPFFKDVPEGSDYFTAVQYMKKTGLIDDKEEYLNPEKEISRAEAVYYILKIILGYEPDAKIPLKKEFNDVSINGVLTPYIAKAVELKIINGYKNSASESDKLSEKYGRGLFKPHKKVNLAEIVKMVLETEKLINSSIIFDKPSEDVFADVPANAWFSGYAKTAKDKRIIKFGRDDKMNPEEIVTKGYLMEILYRLIRSREKIMFGIASFYDGKFNNKKTSSGDIFSSNLFTAAHRTLPFGTVLRVTNLRNSKSVDVVVNDRGPYVKNFTLDLSESAFAQIAPLSNGIIPIEYKIISEWKEK